MFGDNCCRPNSNVYTIGVNGGNLRKLTHVPFGDGDANFPAYSPDGKSIVFSRGDDADGGDLWVMRSDGSHQHAVESSELFVGAEQLGGGAWLDPGGRTDQCLALRRQDPAGRGPVRRGAGDDAPARPGRPDRRDRHRTAAWSTR